MKLCPIVQGEIEALHVYSHLFSKELKLSIYMYRLFFSPGGIEAVHMYSSESILQALIMTLFPTMS